MRRALTIHLGGTYHAQEQPPQQLQQQHRLHQITPPSSGWKSPVPYLFGGLAAMLGLIAFALLILACSYWKLSGYQDNAGDENSGEDTGDEKPKDASSTAYLNSILVIMAGDDKPTFLAMPVSSSVSSFGVTESSKASCSGGCDGGEEKEVEETVVVTAEEDKR